MTKIKSLLKISLPILIPLFFIIFLAGGCSFKLIDPQYYEFRKLCQKSEKIIYDKELYELYANARKHLTTFWYNDSIFYDKNTNRTFFVGKSSIVQADNKNISSRITKTTYLYYYDNIAFFSQTNYWFEYKGLFLKGDEGMGFYFDTNRTLYCNDKTIEMRK